MTESIEQMVDDLKGKLRLVNTSVLNKDAIPEEKREELKEIHTMVMSRKIYQQVKCQPLHKL